MLAFGVDPAANKYKVLRVVCHRDICVTSEVYTVGDTGSWRKVQGCNHAPYGRPVYVKGTIYWFSGPGDFHQEERILSFDLGKEEFRMIQHMRIGRISTLMELGKRLAVVDSSSTTLVEVSVMDDSIPNSWKKEYILPVRYPHKPEWGFSLDWGSPQLLCAGEYKGVLLLWLQHGLIMYERKGFVRRDLRLKGFPTGVDWQICSCFRGSFVSVRHFSDATEDRVNDVCFASNEEVSSMLDGNLVFGEHDEARRCYTLVNCFKQNKMWSH